MTEPTRVLQVVTKMDRGGLETFVMNMYRKMDRDRVQFDFLCHRDGRFAYDGEIESLGGRIYQVPRCNPFDPRYLRSVDSFFAAHPYRVVHSHIDCMSALPLAAAARHGAVVRIAHSHNSRQDKDFKYPLKMVCKRFIRREATDLFACGVEAGRWMFGTDNFTVIRNAIDVDAYAFDEARRERKRSELGIDPSALVVGHVGRFDPVKNHAFILEVFAELLRNHPGAVLLLAGDGGLRVDMERRASEFGMAGSVRFLGVRSDVPDLMQAMDVFLMPSIYEGLPLVLIEAQASGLLCLISEQIPFDCDIVPNGVARLSLSEGANVWAQRLDSLLSFEHSRTHGASFVREAGFEAADVADQLQAFYLTTSLQFEKA